MKTYVEFDYETYSLCDLKQSGAWRYAEDISTEVICLCYEGHVWFPGGVQGSYDDEPLLEYAEDPEVIFVAHNAQFEQAIWHHHMVARYGFPPIPISRWDCTLAACAWKGYPLALDKARQALRLNTVKDKEGNTLTLSMSKTNKKTGNLPVLTPQIRQRIIQYCQQDVVVEHEIGKQIGLISRQNLNERKVWELDQKINQRGVRLDMEFVEAAQVVVDRASAPLRDEFMALTGLTKVGSPRLLEWCASNGLKLDNLQKKTLSRVLEIEDDPSEDGYESLADTGGDSIPLADAQELLAEGLPGNVRRVLEIRAMLAGSAIKKLKRMQACVGYDGRARGLLQYHAAHSGRWGGRLLQPQNFPRESVKGLSPDDVVAAILSREPSVVERETGLPALEAVARSLRHALVPDPGKVFLVGDYKSIEAVIILALAGHTDLAGQLAGGLPIYMRMAEQIYNQPSGTWACEDEVQYAKNKDEFVQEYTIGKNTILGCGFQMGPEKFHSRYCADQPIAFAEQVVETYRKKFAPKVPNVWYRLQEASLKAVQTATAQEAYGITYKPEGNWLTAQLPSRWQKLWYPQPHLGWGKFGDPAWKSMQWKQNKWLPVDMYGGLEAENVVQAMARGVLCGAMCRLEDAGFPLVLSVHDEAIVEVAVDSPQNDLLQFKKLMTQPSAWTEDVGIPIAVEASRMTRYKK